MFSGAGNRGQEPMFCAKEMKRICFLYAKLQQSLRLCKARPTKLESKAKDPSCDGSFALAFNPCIDTIDPYITHGCILSTNTAIVNYSKSNPVSVSSINLPPSRKA